METLSIIRNINNRKSYGYEIEGWFIKMNAKRKYSPHVGSSIELSENPHQTETSQIQRVKSCTEEMN